MGDRRSQIVDRTCASCGSAFQGTRASRLCETCRAARRREGAVTARRADIVTIACRDCGTAFEAHRRRVRCDECRREHELAKGRASDERRRQPGYVPRKVGDTDTCKQCGGTYTVRHINQQLCSDECRRAHRSAYLAARADAKRPQPRECRECGRVFRPKFPDAVYCSKKCNDAVRQRRPEQVEASTRRRLQRQYGIALETVVAMEDAQGDRCLTCGRTLSRAGDKRERLRNAPRVDHDHATGEVRGLLCYWCNVMLGQVDDRPEVLQRMIEYLTLGRFDDPVERVRAFLAEYPLP